jgi:arylsulfatase A-like enzyme
VVSELDYGYRAARRVLGRKPGECRAWMLRTARWKYVHWQGFRPQLFDLEADPAELVDLGRDPAYAGVRDQLHGRLADCHGSLKQRVTVSDEDVERGTDRHREAGIFFGEW